MSKISLGGGAAGGGGVFQSIHAQSPYLKKSSKERVERNGALDRHCKKDRRTGTGKGEDRIII